MAEEHVGAVAICFMNAFANPAHERKAAEIVRAALPEAYLSMSSEVLPLVRFYNRVSTTVLNAYVGPVLGGYIENLTGKLAGAGFDGVLLIMQSNGGVALPEVTLKWPATTLLSGPAGGSSRNSPRNQGEVDRFTPSNSSRPHSIRAATRYRFEIERSTTAEPAHATTNGSGTS